MQKLTKAELKRNLIQGNTITIFENDRLFFKDTKFYYVDAIDSMDQEWPFDYIFEAYKDHLNDLKYKNEEKDKEWI